MRPEITLAVRTRKHKNLTAQSRLLLRSLALIPPGLAAAERCAEKLGVELPSADS